MKVENQLELDDLIVLLIGAIDNNAELRGITRLEKLVFLAEKELQDVPIESAGFSGHHFGPFSARIYQEIDILSAAGIVRDSAKLSQNQDDTLEDRLVAGQAERDPYQTRNFSLTPRGKRYREALLKEVPKRQVEAIERLRKRFDRTPLRQLVRYVYEEYPDYTENSIIRDDILG